MTDGVSVTPLTRTDMAHRFCATCCHVEDTHVTDVVRIATRPRTPECSELRGDVALNACCVFAVQCECFGSYTPLSPGFSSPVFWNDILEGGGGLHLQFGLTINLEQLKWEYF